MAATQTRSMHRHRSFNELQQLGNLFCEVTTVLPIETTTNKQSLDQILARHKCTCLWRISKIKWCGIKCMDEGP